MLLVADKNAQFALKGALDRPEALGIHQIEFEFLVHPGRDGGARKTGPEVLALERRGFGYGMLVLDFEGSGAHEPNAKALETNLDSRLRLHWNSRAKAIVIDPELDVWLWGSDNAVEEALGWPGDKRISKSIREWLQQRNFAFQGTKKPIRPKEALEASLREIQRPRSSALYEQIASRISLQRCSDEAFVRLRTQLVKWFPR